MIASTRPRPKFQIGQIVVHRQYRYRGVIVARDRFCRVPDWWYFRNQTQPAREQAWYHVLVDANSRTTYAAETSLRADRDRSPVDHPAIELFFSGMVEGHYQRNDRPWDGGW